ncbi:sulfurtransferase TusA family protein [Streptomyces hydrogenans]|uniref:sulfurtransferase TusA family protein n=1 Tax=Streptomyces hydrogenans TaxID=1873719 RepID=UPI0036852F12
MHATTGADGTVTAVVDAGGEPWHRVQALLERRLDDLPPGTLLEVVTADRQVNAALPGWCAASGGTLLATEKTADTTSFLLRVPADTEPHVASIHLPEIS